MNDLTTGSEERKKQIVEINGIKMEVDMRYAKRVDHFKVGDRIRLLKETGYSDKTHKVYPGVIVGFEPFKDLPTIIVACVESEYSSCKMEFYYVNAESKGIEIVVAQDDFMPIKKTHILEQFDNELEKARAAVQEVERKKKYFIANFNAYFTDTLDTVERTDV